MKKFCEECRWFSPIGYPRPFSLCLHDEARMLEGGRYPPGLMRTEFHACGQEGKLWEQKPKKVSFWERLFGNGTAGNAP